MAYRADIEIGVRGAARLKELQDRITQLSRAVDDANVKTLIDRKAIQSVEEYSGAAGKAAKTLSETAIQLNAAGKASGNYAEAISQLVTAIGQENNALSLQNELIKEEIELRRKQKLAVAGIQETTQYAGPIGPGPASPVALSSPLRGRTEQILAERKGRTELNTVLQAQFEAEQQLINSELDAKAARVQQSLDAQAAAAVESSAQTKKLADRQLEFTERTEAAARAARAQTAEFIRQQRIAKQVAAINATAPTAQLLLAPAAPGAPAIGGGARRRITGPVERLGGARTVDEAAATLRLAQATDVLANSTNKINPQYNRFLPDTQLLNATGRGIKQLTTNQEAFNQTIASGIRFAAKFNQEQERLRRLGIGAPVSNRMPGTPGVTAGPAGGFPTDGPMASPGFRGMQKKVGNFGENLALGAGFPLLFGGGAGSILGSIAGSFVGTGFGGQILGGALGQALDQTLVRVQTIGNAIKTLDFSKLTESGIKFTRELQTQLNILLSVGDALNAQKIVSQEVARQTGTLPGVTEDIANSVNILGDSWNKIISSVGTLVGIVGAPLAVALAGILEVVAAIARAVNGLVSLFGNGVKAVAEFVIKLVAGEGALKFINDGIRNLNIGLSEAVSQAEELRNNLNETNVNTSIELAAARQMTPGVAPEDKLTNIEVERQKDLNLLFQEEISARVKIRAENAKAGDEIVASLLKQNDLLYKNKAELIEINATRLKTAEIQRQQEDLERKAIQAAEKAAQAREKAFAARISATTGLYAAEKQSYDLQVQDVALFEGSEAAAKQRLKDLTQVQFLDTEILRGERAQALLEAQKTNTVAQTNKLYDKRLANLNQEYALQKAQLQFEINRSQLEKNLAATQRRESIQSAVDPIREQQARVQLSTAGLSMPSAELERQQLALDQIYRLRRAELPIVQEINRLNTEIDSLALTEEAVAAKKLDLSTQQQKLTAVREELDLLSQLEQQQLKLNQLMQQYGNLVVDELSTAMSSAVTAVISGTGTVQQAFAAMFQNIGQAFLDMATRMIAQALVMKVLGILMPGSNTTAAADPLANFNAGALQYRAAGGPVTGGSPYIVGERGPELFVPGRSGTVVPNNQLGSGGSTNVVVNVDASGSKVEGNDQQGNQLGRVIAAAVQQELIKQKRPGGLLV